MGGIRKYGCKEYGYFGGFECCFGGKIPFSVTAAASLSGATLLIIVVTIVTVSTSEVVYTSWSAVSMGQVPHGIDLF